MLGQVKWFNESKGFGFIAADGKDYFVHFKNIKAEGFKTLHEKDNVEFTSFSGTKGMEARDVRVIAKGNNEQ